MAINAIKNLEFEWYEPEREIAEEQGEVISEAEAPNLTGFKIRPLKGFEFMDVINDQGATGYMKALRYGLMGWRNFLNDDPFTVSKAMDFIPAKIQMKIARRIIAISDLDGEQQKNS